MGLLISFGLIAIAFYLMAIVSEDFFVPAIDRIAKKLNLSSDASGATLLAIGSSAPEFFTALFAVWGVSGAGSDVGAGTIVGSAIFNVLVIIGAAAMFKSVKLQWQPVVRDLSFYVITILLLFAVFYDGQVTIFEAGFFILVYFFYVAVVVNWRKLFNYRDEEIVEPEHAVEHRSLRRLSKKSISFLIPIPKKRSYPITFIMSILAIAALSWLMVDQAVHIGNVLNINPTFLALTVLAAGTSISDLIGSIVVARQGRGDMAVSNAVGSNIFDILFGLGIPWLLYMLINGGTILVSKENLISSVILLFATVVAIAFLLIVRNWKIGHKSGLALIGLYVAYCIYIFVSAV